MRGGDEALAVLLRREICTLPVIHLVIFPKRLSSPHPPFLFLDTASMIQIK